MCMLDRDTYSQANQNRAPEYIWADKCGLARAPYARMEGVHERAWYVQFATFARHARLFAQTFNWALY